jgi:hypothetical protein
MSSRTSRRIEVGCSEAGARVARLGQLAASGQTDSEALRSLAVLLRATASEAEALAIVAGDEAALRGACAAVGACL